MQLHRHPNTRNPPEPAAPRTFRVACQVKVLQQLDGRLCKQPPAALKAGAVVGQRGPRVAAVWAGVGGSWEGGGGVLGARE